MNEIDWSKAPEGATHYNHTGFDWYKVTQIGAVFFWNGRAWAPARFWDDRKHDCIQRPTTPSWTGEGLPPVGVRCEAAIPHTSSPNNERSFIWVEGSVIAYHEIKGRQYAWFAEADEGFYPPGVFEFRPIRTPEQIAAELADQAIKEIAGIICRDGAFDIDDPEVTESAAAIYDAGYRKP